MSEPLDTGPVVEPFHKRHRRWLIGWGTLAVLFVLIGTVKLLVDETDNSRGNSSSTGTSADDKYEQTWPKSYSSTTCQEWIAEMTADQRWAAAADMLSAARNKSDGGQGVPPDSLVDEFMGGVTTACVFPEMLLAEVGAGLYLTERARFRP